MEGALFTNRPTLPSQTNKTPKKLSTHNLKFKPQIPLPPPPPSKFLPLDCLLLHLTHQNLTFPSQIISSVQFNDTHQEFKLFVDPRLDFLTERGKTLLNTIAQNPLDTFPFLLNSSKSHLLKVDTVSLLKSLEVLGDWERALVLFQWIVSNMGARGGRLDAPAIVTIVRVLGRESQYSVACKVFDSIPVADYRIDINAYTTLLHAYTKMGWYDKAIDLFEKIKAKGLSPSIVTYNVMLNVYGRKGRSWDKILALLDGMRSDGLDFDEFTYSTVIAACRRDGMLKEAIEFFNELKLKVLELGDQLYGLCLKNLN